MYSERNLPNCLNDTVVWLPMKDRKRVCVNLTQGKVWYAHRVLNIINKDLDRFYLVSDANRASYLNKALCILIDRDMGELLETPRKVPWSDCVSTMIIPKSITVTKPLSVPMSSCSGISSGTIPVGNPFWGRSPRYPKNY